MTTESKSGFWPKTEVQLVDYIRDQLQGPHDYDSCVHAVAKATVATFNYMATQLGITGFQASCADLEVLRATRGLEGPFGILDGSQLLYPQYDLVAKAREWVEKWRPQLAPKAKALLAEERPYPVHPDVLRYWREVAALEPAS